jgi:hypothetical protein
VLPKEDIQADVPVAARWRRLGYAAIAAMLLVAVAFAVERHVAGIWTVMAFGLAPDLALFFGAGKNLRKGQLHPRAVPLYNLLHRFWLPVALVTLAACGVIPPAFLAGGLAWCFHISLDRALGYGLRTRDGFQRP